MTGLLQDPCQRHCAYLYRTLELEGGFQTVVIYSMVASKLRNNVYRVL